MTIRTLILGLLLVGGHSLMAQQPQDHADVLHLKNGRMLHGQVVHTGDTYPLTTPEEQVPSLDKVEIEQHSLRSADSKLDQNPGDQAFSYPQKGLTGSLQLNLLAGTQTFDAGVDPVVTPELAMTMGYRWCHWLAASLGTGMSFFEQGHLLPVFAEVRGDVWPKQSTLFYFGRLGYGFMPFQNETWTDFFGNEREADASGGMMYEAGLGVKIYTCSSVAVSLGISYRAQQATFTSIAWRGNLISDEVSFQRIGMQIGLAF